MQRTFQKRHAMCDIICLSICTEQKSGDTRGGGVVCGGNIVFEEVENGESCEEGGEAPEGGVVEPGDDKG